MRKDKVKKRVNAFIQSKRFFVVITVFMCVLALLCFTLVFLRFVGVGSFEVKGDTTYKLSELISNSGIRAGDMMSSLDERKAEELLLEKCPYLKSVKVKKKFPNKICFEVEERVPGWYIEIGDDYYALDYDLLILLETYDEQSLIDRNLTKLVLPELTGALCGSLPDFGKGDEQLISETLRVIDTFRKHTLKERLTYLNLSNRFEIRLTLDGVYNVNLGDMTDIDTKLETITETIIKASSKGYVGGEINMITPTTCSFRGIFPEPEKPEETENITDTQT